MFEQTLVNNGVELLNKKYPSWYMHINVDKLDMSSHDNCMLGQLYGDFLVGSDRLKVYSHIALVNYGFQCPAALAFSEGKIIMAAYERLTACWSNTILKIRRDKQRSREENLSALAR